MDSISFGHTNSGFQVGVNQGPIYVSQERSEPRPEPLSTVPFSRDPDFVGRNEILDQIQEKSLISGSRIGLVGLGGVGKTRLAIEYCHRIRQVSSDTWVFWVHASNAARCETSLRDLADRAKIPGRQDRNINIFQLIGNWLQDKSAGKWILVLDNVDNDELLRKPLATCTQTKANAHVHALTQPPLRYLLESSNGFIVITTRNKGVALDIVGHKKNLINVQPMDMGEALLLLQNKIDVHTESSEMVKLVEELEFMPLAIVQAASYIVHRSPRCSISQYLEYVRKSGRQAAKLLNHEAGHILRDWEAKNSILLSWQISFDHIRRIRQSAANLLSLMSFFDRQEIPERLLQVQNKERNHNELSSSEDVANSSIEKDTDRSSESDLDHDFEDDIATLIDYSFIYVGEDSTVFTMHRLVQLSARVWLTTQGQLEQWKEQFIHNLYREFPTSKYENWSRCQQLFPHVKSAMSHRPQSQDSRLEWAMLLYRGAWYAWQRGDILTTKGMASKSRKQRVAIFGADSKEALDSTAMLAGAYRLEGAWEEAEQPDVHVVEVSSSRFGDDHPDTLRSMANLSSTYWSQGRWEEAEQLQTRVIEVSRTKLGEGHPDTLRSMANLASTYWIQGRWKEAEQLQVQVTAARKTMLEEGHPDVLRSMANLASIYWSQGRWEEAEPLQIQVMESSRARLGRDHPDTLRSMANLASTYLDQGRWKKAEQLDVQVMEIRKTNLGADHPDTLTSMANLAFTLQSAGQQSQAIDLLSTCVTKQEQILGPSYPDTKSNSVTLLAWETRDLTFDT